MTTPDDGDSGPEVDLTKQDEPAEPPFDPYRFGKPDHPVPPEYAPPGYVPPTPAPPTAPPPYPGPPGQAAPGQPYQPPTTPYPYGAPPYGAPPPGTPPPYGAPPPYGGQHPYGAPPYYGYTHTQPGNGKAITALVMGIVSILLFWTSIFDIVPVILAIVFGIIALNESKGRGGNARGMAVAGIVCGAIGAILAIVMTVLFVHAINKCGGFNSDNRPGFNKCVQDHL